MESFSGQVILLCPSLSPSDTVECNILSEPLHIQWMEAVCRIEQFFLEIGDGREGEKERKKERKKERSIGLRTQKLKMIVDFSFSERRDPFSKLLLSLDSRPLFSRFCHR